MLRARLRRRNYSLKRKLKYLTGSRGALLSSQQLGQTVNVHHLHQRLSQPTIHIRLTTNLSQHTHSLRQRFDQNYRRYSSINHQHLSKDRQKENVFSLLRSQAFFSLTKNILQQQKQESKKSSLVKKFISKVTETHFRPMHIQVHNNQTFLRPAGSRIHTQARENVRTEVPLSRVLPQASTAITTHLLQKNIHIENHQKNEFAVLQKQLFDKIDTTFMTVKQEIHQENSATIVNQVKNQMIVRSGEIAKDVLKELQRSSRVESMRRGL